MGLYQMGQLADRLGYRLRLVENRPGCVRFELDQPAVEGIAKTRWSLAAMQWARPVR